MTRDIPQIELKKYSQSSKFLVIDRFFQFIAKNIIFSGYYENYLTLYNGARIFSIIKFRLVTIKLKQTGHNQVQCGLIHKIQANTF